MQGCSKGQKSGGAGSNAARRRCPAVPSDLPKSGGAVAPPAPPLVICLQFLRWDFLPLTALFAHPIVHQKFFRKVG